LVAADELTGVDVTNIAGEDLGTLEHVVLDLEHQRIAYAVLTFGGFLGFGETLFAVPWSLLRRADDGKVVLDVSKETLEEAPGFDKSDWPDMASREWGQAIHGHYEQPTYW